MSPQRDDKPNDSVVASHQNGGVAEAARQLVEEANERWASESLLWRAQLVARALLSSTDRERKYREALALILPLAKGYAAAHPVGSNQAYVDEAEEALALPTEQDGWLRTGNEARPASEALDGIVALVLNDVAELPDRTSPAEQPDMMLVTADELEDIVRHALYACAAYSPEARPVTRNDVLEEAAKIAEYTIRAICRGDLDYVLGGPAIIGQQIAYAIRALKREGDAP